MKLHNQLRMKNGNLQIIKKKKKYMDLKMRTFNL